MARPGSPIITREKAAQAALSIIDDEGLDKLNLKLVAKLLGVKAPSLYYHFKNKSELLEEVTRLLVLNAIPKKKTAGVSCWKEGIIDICRRTRRSLLQHPEAAPLLLSVEPTKVFIDTYEYWLKAYGAPMQDREVIMEGLEKMTLGSILIGSRLITHPETKSQDTGDSELFNRCLERFLHSF